MMSRADQHPVSRICCASRVAVSAVNSREAQSHSTFEACVALWPDRVPCVCSRRAQGPQGRPAAKAPVRSQPLNKHREMAVTQFSQFWCCSCAQVLCTTTLESAGATTHLRESAACSLIMLLPHLRCCSLSFLHQASCVTFLTGSCQVASPELRGTGRSRGRVRPCRWPLLGHCLPSAAHPSSPRMASPATHGEPLLVVSFIPPAATADSVGSACCPVRAACQSPLNGPCT